MSARGCRSRHSRAWREWEQAAWLCPTVYLRSISALADGQISSAIRGVFWSTPDSGTTAPQRWQRSGGSAGFCYLFSFRQRRNGYKRLNRLKVGTVSAKPGPLSLSTGSRCSVCGFTPVPTAPTITVSTARRPRVGAETRLDDHINDALSPVQGSPEDQRPAQGTAGDYRKHPN
jgi:hypothetical protein